MSIIHKWKNGLQKLTNKILTKLDTLKGNAQSIAKGFATGAAVSFTPFVGFHAMLSLIIAKMTKQSSTAALLGTVVGNPWTFPLIWYGDLHLGRLLLQREQITDSINFIALFKEMFHTLIMLDFDRFFSDIYPVFFPMLIGCIPLYAIVWIVLSRLLSKALIKRKSGGEQ